MNEKEKEAIAVFRYGIIAPVLHSTRRNQKSYFEEMAERPYDVPHLGKKRYRWRSFKKWLHLYRKDGFEGLKPKIRADKGKTRKIDDRLKEVILDIKENMPFLTPSNLYRRLLSEGHITTSPISEGTLRNFLKVRGLDHLLYQTIRRRVKNDSTVSIGSKLYEAPPEYIRTIIEIRFPTERPDDLTLYEDGKPICPLKPLDIHLNSKAPSQGISFSTNKNQKEKEET